MKNETLLYDDGNHKCIMFSLEDEDHQDYSLSVNQFLIIQHESAVLIDPGSEGIFGELYDAVSAHIDPQKIKYIFFPTKTPMSPVQSISGVSPPLPNLLYLSCG